jgi:hypothetical protein
MGKLATFGAVAALATAFAVPALAQGMGASDPSAATPPSSASGSAAGAATDPAAGAAAGGASSGAASGPSASASPVAVGQAVKDKTGATIGKVSDVKTEADGKTVATIQMGADTFAVDTSALAVDKGSAVINATQAEIKGMMKK